MRLKLIALGLLVVLALSLLACSPEAAEEPVSPETSGAISVDCDSFMNQKHITDEVTIVGIADGGSFTVILCSNPTTGFEWSEAAQISDTAVLQQVAHKYVAPDSEMVGSSGKEVWTFQALKDGTSTISMEYSRPWEGGEKGEWTYTLTVTVK